MPVTDGEFKKTTFIKLHLIQWRTSLRNNNNIGYCDEFKQFNYTNSKWNKTYTISGESRDKESIICLFKKLLENKTTKDKESKNNDVFEKISKLILKKRLYTKVKSY